MCKETKHFEVIGINGLIGLRTRLGDVDFNESGKKNKLTYIYGKKKVR